MNHHWITDAPRQPLGFLPTPLTPLERLGRELGGPRIWIKRDDCTGLATGGNKTRKLEYLLADARREGADVVVTFGATQSNHARQTAAACAAVGLPCHLLLARKVPWPNPAYERSGNLLLDRILGAEVHLLDPEAVVTHRKNLLEALEVAGHLPYLIPVGGSNAIGAMGYARCAMELLEQAEAAGFDLTDIVHASSSAGTQAGLITGFAGLLADAGPPERRPRVHGINVSEPDPQTLIADVRRIATELIERQGLDVALTDADIRVDHRYLGPGYGLPDAGVVAAIRRLARTEGILLDPVYSGKAFAALLDRIARGEFAGSTDVVFLHTGGSAALGVYDDAF